MKETIQKTTLIFLPGGPGMGGYGDILTNNFNEDFNTVSVEFGNTPNGELHQYMAMIDDQVNLTSGPVVICGHSFGGALALEYVHRFAAKVSQLVLISWVQDNGWIEYLYKNNPGYVNPRVQFAAEFSQLNEEQAFLLEVQSD